MALKCPPKLVSEEGYEAWRRDVLLWGDTTEMPKKKQAVVVHLEALNGRARTASSELSDDVLRSEGGLNALIEKLDGLFMVDKGRKQFMAFQGLYDLRRKASMEVRRFLSDFEHAYFRFEKQGMTLPCAVKAFMLLASCGLSEGEQRLVMTALKDITYENMKDALNRIFYGYGSKVSSTSGEFVPEGNMGSVKCEPVLVSEGGAVSSETEIGSDGVMFTRGGSRGRSRVRSVGRGRQASRVNEGSRGEKFRRQNPLGRDGKVSRCVICDSRFHWARECPDAYENVNRESNSGRGAEAGVYGSRDGGVHKEGAYLSLFLGYTGAKDKEARDKEGKIKRLVVESKGCVVLDSGCSSTVCGAGWYRDFLEGFSEYERSKVVMEDSTATFTFADGVTVPSIMRVTLPCVIGGMCGTITTDVVECDIPLLLSRYSMKRAEMIMNFITDQVKVKGTVVDLLTSTSGHYLMPVAA